MQGKRAPESVAPQQQALGKILQLLAPVHQAGRGTRRAREAKRPSHANALTPAAAIATKAPPPR